MPHEVGERGAEFLTPSHHFIIENATLAETDEALQFLGQVPELERGSAWHSMSDRVLDHRRILTEAMNAQLHERITPRHETAALQPPETR